MAETTEKLKPTKVKYKFGADELDLQDYLNNLERNLQSYLEYNKNWDEALREGFKSAYRRYLNAYQDLLNTNSGRLYTSSDGNIHDIQELLGDEDSENIIYYYDNKNNRITADDYNKLNEKKLKKYTRFSSNSAVRDYFNTIGRALADARRKTVTNDSKFNLAKHGFERWFTTHEYPNGSGDFDFAPYLEKDAVDEATGLRGTTERSKYLAQLFLNYLNDMGDLDYSESTYKNKENYIDTIKAAINNLNNGYNYEDTIALRQAGLSNKFLNNFFYTGKKEEKEEETELEKLAKAAYEEMKERAELSALEALVKLNNEEKAQEAAKKAQEEIDNSLAEYLKNNPYTSKGALSLSVPDFNGKLTDKALNEKYKLNPSSSTYVEDVKKAVRDHVNFPLLVKYMRNAEVYKGKEAIAKLLANNLKYADTQGLFKEKELMLGDTGYYIIPGSEDSSNYTFLAYNPKDNTYQEFSMILNKEFSDDLNKELRKRMAYDAYKKNNQTVLKKLTGGTLTEGFAELREEALKKLQLQAEIKLEAKETGKSEEQVAAGYRKPSETGWTAAEYARMASAILDIGSIISSFVPGYGTVASAGLGLGSTIGNLYADLNDDSMSGLDVAKNAGLGLALDVVGLLPGLGTLKVTKIAKTLKNIAPTAIGIWSAYLNGDAPIKAMNKLMKGEDLTVNDWQALSSGLQMLAGGAGYVRGRKAIKNATSQRDVADVRTDRGNMATILREDFDKLRKLEGFLKLDEMFSNLTGGLHLQREFKNRDIKFIKFWNSRFKSQHPDYKTRTESTVMPEATGWDAKFFRWLDGGLKSTPLATSNKSKNETVFNLPVPTNPLRFNVYDKNAKRVDKMAEELRVKQQEEWIENVRNIDDEHFKKSGPGTLTSSNELETVNADQLRFINNFFRAIPTMTPRSSGSTPNLPAVVPKLQIKLSSSEPSPFDSNKIKEGLARAKEERLGRDIGNTRAQRAIEANSERISRLLALEASNNVRKAFNTYGTPLIKKPLTGAARKAKENMYSLLFGEVNLVTEPVGVSLVPKTPRKPTLALHNKKLEALEKIWPPIEGMTKSPKGILRALRKAEAKAEAQAKKQAEELAEKLAEEQKRIINELPYISESKKREMANGKKPNKKPKKTSKDVNIKRRKEGGTLDLNKVRKFQGGGTPIDIANLITSLALNDNFFTNLYSLKKLYGWDLSKDDSKAGGSIINENALHGNAGDLSTAAYKNFMYINNPDIVRQDLQSYYDSDFKGKSLEEFTNGYNSVAEKIRNFWNLKITYGDTGALDHNRNFKSLFPSRSDNSENPWNIGYDPKLEDIKGSSTWLRRMDRREKEFEDLSDEEKKSRIYKIDLGNGNTGYVYKKANGDIGIYNPTTTSVTDKPVAPVAKPAVAKDGTVTTGNKKIDPLDPSKNIKTIPQILMEGINDNPTAAWGLIQNILLDKANREMKETPNPIFNKDPFEVHRYVRSDLDAEMQGERNYANIRLLARRPLTSDGGLLTATLLLGEVLGLAERTAKKEKSNQTLREYMELAFQQEKENAANRHDTAMFNRLQQWAGLLDKIKRDWAYLSKRATNWNTFLQELRYKDEVKQKEKKALEDLIILSDIRKESINNLAKYAPELSPAALDIWNLVVSGSTTPSELYRKDPAKWLLYQQAMRAQLLAEYDLLKQHYGINSPFGRVRLATNTYTPSITKTAKKGGILSTGSQIAVAGIKAKTADAERFQRQIKECIDRNEKAIDRLSKSLYGIIKASILK